MLDSEQDEEEQEEVDDEGNIETKVQQGTGMISSVFPQAAINENIVSQQDEKEEEEENHKKKLMKKMNKAAAAAPGKILKGDTRGRKSPSSSPASRRTTPQKINLVAEGHAIVLPQVQPHVVDGFTAESLSGRTATQVENLMTSPGEGFQSSSQKSKKKSSKAAGNSSDDELTSRAIRACLAAEAVMAALREECVLLHHAGAAAATVSEEYKNPMTEDGGTGTQAVAGLFRMKKGHSVGKLSGSAAAPPPNGQLSLQLQLAACENLSLAATAAFRELITSRLGFNMPAAHPGQYASTLHEEGLSKIPQMKHQRKPIKKPNLLKLPQLNLHHQPSYCASCSPSNSKGRHHQSPGQPQGLRAGQRQYMNRGKFSMSIDGGKFSKPFEEPSCGGPCVPGPFSCSHPPTTVMSMHQQQHSCYSGTLLNGSSRITIKTANALRAAMKMGVQVIIATGKTRPAALAALETVGLTGKGGVLSHTSPGVFLQGLQVYGKQGTILHSQLLDPKVVSETFKFSMEHQVPLVGFSADKCVTLFAHTWIDKLHEVYYEPQAEVMKSIDQIMEVKVQKVLFYDLAERVANFLRPHWSLAARGRATIVQALPDMLEILPIGASKGAGVQMLVDHMEVPIEQVMAIGDGENDIEMLSMVGWGVAMANATERTKAVADAVTSSNNEDGVAQAIQNFILSGVFY